MAMKQNKPGEMRNLRIQLSKRFGCICWYCNRALGVFGSHVDHVIPISSGGTDDFGNLALACGPCNRAKLDMPLSDFILWLEHIRFGPAYSPITGSLSKQRRGSEVQRSKDLIAAQGYSPSDNNAERRRHPEDRPCPACGGAIVGRHINAKFCSEECKRAFKNYSAECFLNERVN